VLVFATGEQAEAFLQAVGQSADAQYVDGRRVADHLGITLPPDEWKVHNRKLIMPNRRLAALVK
jgi:hypothetical protein